MSGTKVNDYSISDTNIETLMLTTDQIFKGKCECTLTEMDTTTVPEIAAGSYIEVNGTLFKFDSDESISTTDPVTSSTVADGTVYVMIVPSTDTCTAAFTATAPTWSDSKRGWYGTGAYASYRYLDYEIIKATSSYLKRGIAFNMPRRCPVIQASIDLGSRSTTFSDQAVGLTPIIDYLSEISSSSDTITIKYSGLYRVDVCLHCEVVVNDYANLFLTLKKNSANIVYDEVRQRPAVSTTSVSGYLKINRILNLNAGDILGVTVGANAEATFSATWGGTLSCIITITQIA